VLRHWIRASPSRKSFSGWLRPVGAQSNASISVGGDGGGRAVWVSARGGGELGWYRGSSTSGFGSMHTSLRSRGSLEASAPREGWTHGASAVWVEPKNHVRAFGFHVGPPGLHQAPRYLGTKGTQRSLRRQARGTGEKAGGFGLQYRRAWFRPRAIDYGNCAVKQGSRDLHRLATEGASASSTEFGALRRAGFRALVVFGRRAGRVRSVRGLANSVTVGLSASVGRRASHSGG